MIINLILFVALFSVPKKKLNPYAAAGILGLIKAVLYTLFGGGPVAGAVMGIIFFGLATSFVYFLGRAESRITPEELSSRKSTFKWEHILVGASATLLIFGEMVLTLLIAN